VTLDYEPFVANAAHPFVAYNNIQGAVSHHTAEQGSSVESFYFYQAYYFHFNALDIGQKKRPASISNTERTTLAISEAQACQRFDE
jgi:hypothetical protein